MLNFAAAEAIARTVLYEGYLLYPYRHSAIKNRQRWTFGGLYPPAASAEGASRLHCELLVEGDHATRIGARLRFLHLVRRTGRRTGGDRAGDIRAAGSEGDEHGDWDEAVEREVDAPPATIGDLLRDPLRTCFAFPATTFNSRPDAEEDDAAGAEGVRIERSQAAIDGSIAVAVRPLADDLYRLVIDVTNDASPDSVLADVRAAQARALLSTHVLAAIDGGSGRFVSLIDPPAHRADAARECVNAGAWPVLAGPAGSRDTMLCSPIILYDWPQLAPASPGDLFDGTEIDEILSLRILTLTDAEKREMAATDDRARALLARTEALTEEDFLRMHGVMRDPEPAPPGAMQPAAHDARGSTPTSAARSATPANIQVGDRVRLQPRAGGDVFDLVLAGETAIVEAIDVDFENRVHVAVTVDADPGRDLGFERMPGHRFFFSPDEIVVLAPRERA